MPSTPRLYKRVPKIRRIGIIGPSGSQSHEAFLRQFVESEYTKVFVTRKDGATPFRELIEKIVSGGAVCSFVPFYNTRKAYFHGVPGYIIKNRLHVVDFRPERISQHLITTKEINNLSKVSGVLTNEQCFEQSKDWLLKHLPHITANINFPSSSNAARKVIALNRKNKRKKYAVVGARLLTKLPGLNLKVLRRNLEMEGKDGARATPNITTFCVVSHRPRRLAGNPYGLYAFPLKAGLDMERKWINSRIVIHGFITFSSWIGRNRKTQTPEQYLYLLHTGDIPARVRSFEREMKRRYGRKFTVMGRVSSRLTVRPKDSRVK
jgi:prephenate dehydratase